MSLDTSPSSPGARDIVGEYIIGIDFCRSEELGIICKAFKRNTSDDSDTDAPWDSRYVALLRLHQWCKFLPQEIRERLHLAVQESFHFRQKLEEENAGAASAFLINYVLDAQIFGNTLAQGADSNVDHIVTRWAADISPQNLFKECITDPLQAIRFISELTQNLITLKQAEHAPHLRPTIHITNLRQTEIVSSEWGNLILDDCGFAAVLGQIQVSSSQDASFQERDDIQRLAELLIQLLDGIARFHNNELPGSLGELSRDISTVQKQYPNATRPNQPTDQLWSILHAIIDRTSDRQKYASLQSFSAALVRPRLPLAPGKNIVPATISLPQRAEAESEKGAKRTGENLPTRRDRAAFVGTPAATSSAYDRLEIEYRRTREIFEQRIAYRRNDGQRDPLADTLIIIGTSPIHEGATTKMVQGTPPIISNLLQRHLYLQRRQDSATGETYYYTLADFGFAPDQESVRVDDVPISPLFAVLLTEQTKVEVQDYRIKLFPTESYSQSGWVVAKNENIPALSLFEKRFVATPGSNTIAVPVTISNPTNEVDRLTVIVDGMPADWPLPPPVQIRLFDKEQEQAMLSIPLPPFRFGGEYEFCVRLISDNIDAQVEARTIQVTVPPQYEFTGFLHPTSLRAGDRGEVHVQNTGNIHQQFVITWRDGANELDFNPAQMRIGMAPHQEGTVHYRAYAQRPHIFGREKRHEIQVMVAPQNGGQTQTLSGQVRSRALIRPWMPLVALLLVVGFILLASFLFVPEFVRTSFAADNTPVTQPVASENLALNWTSINTCRYSIYQNGQGLVLRQPQPIVKTPDARSAPYRYQYKLVNATAGDELELRLHGCVPWQRNIWQATVMPAPATATPTPTDPGIQQFDIHVTGVEGLQMGMGGVEDVQPELNAIPELVIGQTGDLCFQWRLNEVNEGFQYTIHSNAPVDTLPRSIEEVEGQFCLVIADTLQQEGEVLFMLRVTDNEETVRAVVQKAVRVVPPICTVNTDIPLRLREGPGRTYPERGTLRTNSPVTALSRPFFPHEQPDSELWLQVALPNDPRPVWVAYVYLFCPKNVEALPDAMAIPPTPTTTPTLTPEPTLTPTPELEPEVSLSPEIIPVGGCSMLKWNIQNVREVYLNDEGVAGEAERTVCPEAPGTYEYTWRIENLDGSTEILQRTLIVNPAIPAAPTPP